MNMYTTQELVSGLGLDIQPPSKQKGEPQKKQSVHPEGKIPIGKRHTEITSKLASLRGEGLCKASLLWVAKMFNESRCAEPLPEKEIQDLVSHFGHKATGEERAAPELINFAELAETDISPPKYIIQHLLPEGLTVFAGAAKIGKSFLVQGLSISVASGKDALGHYPVDQGTVLHLALEDTKSRFKNRMVNMLQGEPVPTNAVFANWWPRINTDSTDDRGPDGLERIETWLCDHKDLARLVVIDIFEQIRPRTSRNKGVYTLDYEAMVGLQRLAGEYRVAIIVVFHTNQGEHVDILNTISGTTGTPGAADSAWILEKERERTGATLFITGRDVKESKMALEFDGVTGVWTYLGDAGLLDMTPQRREVIKILANGDTMSPAQVAAKCEPEQKAKTIQKRLDDMAGDAQIVKIERGRYSLPPESPYLNGGGCAIYP